MLGRNRSTGAGSVNRAFKSEMEASPTSKMGYASAKLTISPGRANAGFTWRRVVSGINRVAPNHQVRVAEENGQIVGTYFLQANQLGAGDHVANAAFATHPEAAGRGVATALCTPRSPWQRPWDSGQCSSTL